MINILIREFASKQAVADEEALDQFQKQWSTYQKLVDADALSHRAAGNLLRDVLCAIPTTFAFVDIACGDASQMREVLPGTRCRHYHGIDLSAPALELAVKNMADATFSGFDPWRTCLKLYLPPFFNLRALVHAYYQTTRFAILQRLSSS
jgi:hypothetical protein